MIRIVGAAMAVVLIAAAAYAAFRYFGARSSSLTVCQGEAREGCGDIPHWINCETDPVAWITAVRPGACVTATVRKLSEKPGGKCGYATLELRCSTR